MEDSTYEETGQERDWLGPKDETKHLVFHGQSSSTETKWFFTKHWLELDPNYSEFSVRIHDPRSRSLSFINRTLAILPKSKLRAIHNLIGAYLNEHDKNTT